MVRAHWNGVVIAESDDTVVVEGNHYFPFASLDPRYLVPSRRRLEQIIRHSAAMAFDRGVA
jgi:uncharacterized protein (DUF427 family)